MFRNSPARFAAVHPSRADRTFPGCPGNHCDVPQSKDPPLAADGRGHDLVSFARGTEDAPPLDAPLPTALVAIWHADRVLMVFDRFRQGWELPGGRIEEGESSRQAAARE
ncbi:NUDIX hydrolase [Streptomyces sp. NPDC024017]|uniref:NUDIX hydrolase n=1 Tax=Streptomyces sp. NPDC024017 TaxID=3154326 RepID=UPI0033FFD401